MLLSLIIAAALSNGHTIFFLVQDRSKGSTTITTPTSTTTLTQTTTSKTLTATSSTTPPSAAVTSAGATTLNQCCIDEYGKYEYGEATSCSIALPRTAASLLGDTVLKVYGGTVVKNANGTNKYQMTATSVNDDGDDGGGFLITLLTVDILDATSIWFPTYGKSTLSSRISWRFSDLVSGYAVGFGVLTGFNVTFSKYLGNRQQYEPSTAPSGIHVGQGVIDTRRELGFQAMLSYTGVNNDGIAVTGDAQLRGALDCCLQYEGAVFASTGELCETPLLHWGPENCTFENECGVCEGGCDENADCKEGLVCVASNSPPGCADSADDEPDLDGGNEADPTLTVTVPKYCVESSGTAATPNQDIRTTTTTAALCFYTVTAKNEDMRYETDYWHLEILINGVAKYQIFGGGNVNFWDIAESASDTISFQWKTPPPKNGIDIYIDYNGSYDNVIIEVVNSIGTTLIMGKAAPVTTQEFFPFTCTGAINTGYGIDYYGDY